MLSRAAHWKTIQDVFTFHESVTWFEKSHRIFTEKQNRKNTYIHFHIYILYILALYIFFIYKVLFWIFSLLIVNNINFNQINTAFTW